MTDFVDRCEDCPYDDCRTVPSDGNPFAHVFVVGEAPGHYEAGHGQPFIGKSGQLLWTALAQYDIDRRDCFSSNAVLCYRHGNPTPTRNQLDACRGRLLDEIETIDPRIILTVGATAMRTLLGRETGIWDTRGRIYSSDALPAPVLPTIHPAACLREPSTFRDFLDDCKRVREFLDHDRTIDSPDVSWESFYQTGPAIEYLESIDDGTYISADLETTGFDPRTDRILTMGVSVAPGEAKVFTEPLFREKAFRDMLQEKLESPQLHWIWQNGAFDVKFFRYIYNIQARVDEDTMLAHYTLDERSGDTRKRLSGLHNLEYLAKIYFNAPNYEEGFLDEAGINDKGEMEAAWRDVPETVCKYVSKDADYTRRLLWALGRDLEDEYGTTPWFYRNILIPASNMLADIELQGFRADTDHLDALDEEYSQRLETIEEELESLAREEGWNRSKYVEDTSAKSTPDYFNPRSPKQVAYVLFDCIGLPEYDGRTTKAAALEHWDETVGHPFVSKMLEYRKAHKLYSTYIKKMWDHIDEDQRVRASFLLHGTETGRLSSRGPNLQQIPRQSDIRDIFCAEDEYVLVDADYSQAELRTLAVLSGDENLLNVYREGRDLHDETAMEIYGEDFTKEERSVVKRLAFGLVYGGGPSTLAEQVNTTTREAQRLIYQWSETYPQAWEWLEGVAEKPQNNEVVETPFGRRRRFPLITKHNAGDVQREARNFPIQSVASDLLMLGAIELHENHLNPSDARIVNLVHDSIVFEVGEDRWEEIARNIQNVMDDTARESLDAEIPFKVDTAVGQSWGTLKEVDL